MVEKWSGPEWNASRCALHQADIVRDIPCILRIDYSIVLDEVLGPEQEPEVVMSVLGCKCASNESVNDDVIGRQRSCEK